jgi:hypothetical protein
VLALSVSPRPSCYVSFPSLTMSFPTENEPTAQEVESWNKDTLLNWIQKNLDCPLPPKDEKAFINAEIDGSVLLESAGSKEYFKDAGLSFGASVKLAKLARKIMKSKYSIVYSI